MTWTPLAWRDRARVRGGAAITSIKRYAAAIFEAEEGGFWAEVLELPGCVAQGEDLAELQAALPTAIEVWEDVAREIAADSTDPFNGR